MNQVTNLLDAELDDLADLPEFKPFPNGTHTAKITFEEKVVGTHPALIAHLTAIETVELADAGDAPLTAGDVTDVAYMLDNEFGVGSLKELLKPLGAALGLTNTRAIIEGLQNAELLITTKVRSN